MVKESSSTFRKVDSLKLVSKRLSLCSRILRGARSLWHLDRLMSIASDVKLCMLLIASASPVSASSNCEPVRPVAF